MKCENIKCNKDHDGSFGSGRFCCRSCANSFSISNDSNKDDTKQAICIKCKKKILVNKRSSLLNVFCDNCRPTNYNHNKGRKCNECGNPVVNNSKTGYCKNCFITLEYRKKLSDIVKDRVKRGLHKGWNSRDIRSYPELFLEKVLKNSGIEYISEYPIRKRLLGIDCDANYFLDFFFPEKNIDLEIDGKQHELPDRKKSDETRDFYLIKNGFNVYRIKWKSINDDKGKEYMKNEIEKFFIYYDNQKGV